MSGQFRITGFAYWRYAKVVIRRNACCTDVCFTLPFFQTFHSLLFQLSFLFQLSEFEPVHADTVINIFHFKSVKYLFFKLLIFIIASLYEATKQVYLVLTMSLMSGNRQFFA